MANNAATNTSDDEQPFEFMDLPREMRDHVYDKLTEDEVPIGVNPGKDGLKLCADLTATIMNAPLSACLLISRQFSTEYLESIQRNRMTTLRLRDTNQYHLDVPELARPVPMSHIHNLELQLATSCDSDFDEEDHSNCSCLFDLTSHKTWMEELLRHSVFSQINQCRVSLCFNRPRATLEDVLRVKKESLAEFSQVTSVDCYHSDYGSDDHNQRRLFRRVWQEKDLKKTIFASWTRSQGWVEQTSEVEDFGNKADATQAC